VLDLQCLRFIHKNKNTFSAQEAESDQTATQMANCIERNKEFANKLVPF